MSGRLDNGGPNVTSENAERTAHGAAFMRPLPAVHYPRTMLLAIMALLCPIPTLATTYYAKTGAELQAAVSLQRKGDTIELTADILLTSSYNLCEFDALEEASLVGNSHKLDGDDTYQVS